MCNIYSGFLEGFDAKNYHGIDYALRVDFSIRVEGKAIF